MLSIQHYVIKFVSDLRQVGGFLRVLRFPPPSKTDRHNKTEILLKVALITITLTANPIKHKCCTPHCLYSRYSYSPFDIGNARTFVVHGLSPNMIYHRICSTMDATSGSETVVHILFYWGSGCSIFSFLWRVLGIIVCHFFCWPLYYLF